jgi:hypothetical protein
MAAGRRTGTGSFCLAFAPARALAGRLRVPLCADSLTFAFGEASLRKASLMAIHALHMPAISRAWSSSDLAGIEAEAARQLAGLLDTWRKKYPDVPVGQDVVQGQRAGRWSAYPPAPTWWSSAGMPVSPACQVQVQSGTPS